MSADPVHAPETVPETAADGEPRGQAVLDDLVALLDLERLEDNLFRGVSPPVSLRRVFGDVRINVVVASVVFIGAVLYVAFARRGREEYVAPEPADTAGPGQQGRPQEREDA